MNRGPERVLGRYALHGEIAAGGMATVHFGRLLGPVGFSRTVAIKRLHPQFARDPDFVAMFLDEARLAARIQHPNVIATVDVVAQEDELFLVMEYVEGETLSRVLRARQGQNQGVPLRVVGAILSGTLYGLHAAHEAKNERGEPMMLIHRDVSPQNILVGADGVPRVLDFGIAKAVGRTQTTRDGQIKGKIAYMPPEQITGDVLDQRVDVYAAGVVAWETVCGRRLFEGENEAVIFGKILKGEVPLPSTVVPGIPPEVDAVVMRALAHDREHRFATAWDMAVAVEEAFGIDSPRKVAAFVQQCAQDAISRRMARVRQLESLSGEQQATASSVLVGGVAPHHSSSADVTRPNAKPSTRPLMMALGVMAAMGALVAIVVLALVGPGRNPPTASAGATNAAEPRPQASEPAAPTTEAAGPSAAPIAPSASVVVTSSSAPLAAPGSAPTSWSTAAGPRPGPTATAAKSTGSPPAEDRCKVPYVIVDGIRKLKPECI